MATPTIARAGWIAVNSRQACAACGKGDYCTRTTDGLLCKCMRVESNRPIKQKDGSTAWVHVVADLGAPIIKSNAKQQTPRLSRAEIELLLKRHKSALTTRRLGITAQQLAVSEKSLRAYGLGYDDATDCVSAPMFNGLRKPIGIHLRGTNGKKMAVKGSRNGLFVPADYEVCSPTDDLCKGDPSPLLLLTPEGLSDCCAARDAGFRAVGRPSNSAGGDHLAELLTSESIKQDVVLIADRDETKFLPDGTPHWPGIEGALSVAEQLIRARCFSRLRFLLPPPGFGKDVREWMSKTHGSAELMVAILGASRVTPVWIDRAKKRLDERRKVERQSKAA